MEQPPHPSRRTFLTYATGSVAASGAAQAGSARRLKTGRVLGANDRINLGFIGCGMRFQGLSRGFKQRRGDKNDIEFLAACDVYQRRRESGKETLSAPEAYLDYHEVLDRDDIDGVIVAVPDHWHHRIASEACMAGKDVYLEKPMTYTVEEAADLSRLVQKTGRVMQVGVTGMYAGIYPAVRKYIEAGGIGKPVWATTSYCRNNPEGEWNYPIDEGAGPDNIDWTRWLGPAPKRAFSKERYFRWRKFKDYSGGVATDLLYHRLSPLVYMLGEEFPARVTASGGIYLFKDREVPDNFFMNVEYPGSYTIVLISSMTNAMGVPTKIYGQYGTVEFTGQRDNAARVIPEKPFLNQFRERNNGNTEVKLEGEDRPDMVNNWLDAMRSRGKTYLDAELGYKVMTAIKLGVDSYFVGEEQIFDPNTQKRVKKTPPRPMYRPGDSAV